MDAFGRMWADLAPVGRHPATGGYRRYAWTRTDAVLRECFRGEARLRGLDVVPDRAGNRWAWTADPDTAADAGRPGLAVGSHLDSVPDGGAFDGPLRVVPAFAALDLLRARGLLPRRPLRRRLRRLAAAHRGARSGPRAGAHRRRRHPLAEAVSAAGSDRWTWSGGRTTPGPPGRPTGRTRC